MSQVTMTLDKSNWGNGQTQIWLFKSSDTEYLKLPEPYQIVNCHVLSCSGEVYVHHADWHSDDQTEGEKERTHQILLPG